MTGCDLARAGEWLPRGFRQTVGIDRHGVASGNSLVRHLHSEGFEMSGVGGVGGAGNPWGNYGSNQPSGFTTQATAGGNPRPPSTLNPKAKVFETENTKLISEDYKNALQEFSSLAKNVSFHNTRKNQELGKAQVLFQSK